MQGPLKKSVVDARISASEKDLPVNRAYLVNMLTRLLSWSKIVKNVLT